MTSFGFIMTRHVRSALQNKYWNHNVKLLRSLYGINIKIVIIDDASIQSHVIADTDIDHTNIVIIQSEYPGRGELLPYIYYLKHGLEWFETAVIIHDSVFFHKHIPFDRLARPVVFLWNHKYDFDNLKNIRRMMSYLKNSSHIASILFTQDISMASFSETYHLCFGAMCAIKYSFLQQIEDKYKISNLVNCIRCRVDRCAFERIIGVIICHEYPKCTTSPSLFGDIITNFYKSGTYNYSEYMSDLKINIMRSRYGVIKIWTGR